MSIDSHEWHCPIQSSHIERHFLRFFRSAIEKYNIIHLTRKDECYPIILIGWNLRLFSQKNVICETSIFPFCGLSLNFDSFSVNSSESTWITQQLKKRSSDGIRTRAAPSTSLAIELDSKRCLFFSFALILKFYGIHKGEALYIRSGNIFQGPCHYLDELG